MRLSREQGCLSELALDEWASGELDAPTRERTRAHLDQCAHCRARHAALERERTEFYEAAPSFDRHARRVRRARASPPRPHRALATAAAAMTVAAAVLVAVFVRSDQTRLKGGPSIAYYVKRGSQVTAGDAATVVRPGDLLRFVYTSDRDRHFALFNRDARSASVYYPAGVDAIAVRAGQAVPLEFSVELDDVPGDESVYALFCSHRFALEPLRAALADTGRLPVPAKCQVDILRLRKEPAR